jgi:hypothetical protein
MRLYKHKTEEAGASRTRNYEGGQGPAETVPLEVIRSQAPRVAYTASGKAVRMYADLPEPEKKPKRKKPPGWRNMTRAERRIWKENRS